ncbi:MAG TPA: SDR family NAD(P)-dependent oxidoreductase [Candidatus Acidoferrum sp.]|jgi:NAD(P)-dependent dehydrogenase (short-subunit alcohol dehydrogenase family)
MKNKVVLITGANGGLGTTITRSFIATGAAVTGVSNKILAEDFPQPNFTAISADLTKASAAADVVQSVVKRAGRLDILIHVLGGFAGGKSIAETDDATWQQMQDLNLSAAFYVLRAAIPHLRKSGSGRIVAIGSLAALEPHAGIGAYVTFKSALVSLVRTVALENSDAGVTANVILPDTMDTPGNRKAMPNADPGKWVATQDVADLALWLADDRAAHSTGTAIPIAAKS